MRLLTSVKFPLWRRKFFEKCDRHQFLDCRTAIDFAMHFESISIEKLT
ncbi:hypothetical protein NIES2104_11360 [Leptolyngbya sp. NIES-2104]|nr:hypothetical protein NIES2104_11360 [Leptolyngbya sp. NIES-2104]